MFKINNAVIGCLFMIVAASVFAQELDYAKQACVFRPIVTGHSVRS